MKLLTEWPLMSRDIADTAIAADTTTATDGPVMAPPIPLAKTKKRKADEIDEIDEIKTKNTKPKNPRGKGVALISQALDGLNSARDSSTAMMSQLIQQQQMMMGVLMAVVRNQTPTANITDLILLGSWQL